MTVRGQTHRAVVLAAVIALGWVLLAPASGIGQEAATRQATRPTLDSSAQMLEAGIAEGPPFAPDRTADRAVTFRIVTAGRPSCAAGEASPRYMFLIDARPWLAGGEVLDGVPEIRLQSKIEMACDPASRQYVLSSNRAPVVVSPVAAPARPASWANTRSARTISTQARASRSGKSSATTARGSW